MVTYGGMSKKPITVSTSSFIFKVILVSFFTFLAFLLLCLLFQNMELLFLNFFLKPSCWSWLGEVYGSI